MSSTTATAVQLKAMDTPLVIKGDTVIECPVCYEPINNEKNNCKTQCGHSFCFTCIATTLQTQNSCPICRQALFTPPVRGGEITVAFIEDIEEEEAEWEAELAAVMDERERQRILDDRERQRRRQLNPEEIPDRTDFNRQREIYLARQRLLQDPVVQERIRDSVQTAIQRIFNTTRTDRDETRDILLGALPTAIATLTTPTPPTTTTVAVATPPPVEVETRTRTRGGGPQVRTLESTTNRTHFNTLYAFTPDERRLYFNQFPERETRYNAFAQRQRDAYNTI
jgi:hypothetical protein